MLSPETPHSPNAQDIESAYWIMLVIGVALIAIVNAVLIAALLRYRAHRNRRPSPALLSPRAQLRTGLALGALAVIVFVIGVVYTESASDVAPSGPAGLQASAQRTAQLGLDLPSGDAPDPLRITASGEQWIWRYEYPDGTYSYYELVVPVDTSVVVQIDSIDVVHRWWVPSLGGMFDAVPGSDNRTWFRADEVGEFSGRSAIFSGSGYATMRTRVRVVSVPEYETWLDQQSAGIAEAQRAVQQQVLAERRAPEAGAR